MSRESSTPGTCSIAIDVRNPVPNNGSQQTGRYNSMADIVALLVFLQAIVDDDAKVFFDFGVVTIINVNLSKLRQRLEGGTP